MATQNAVLDMDEASPPLLDKADPEKVPIAAILHRLFHRGFCDPWKVASVSGEDEGAVNGDAGHTKAKGKGCEDTRSVCSDDNSTILSTSSPMPRSGVMPDSNVQEVSPPHKVGKNNLSAMVLLVAVAFVCILNVNLGSSGRNFGDIRNLAFSQEQLVEESWMHSYVAKAVHDVFPSTDHVAASKKENFKSAVKRRLSRKEASPKV